MEARANRSLQSYPSYRKLKQLGEKMIIEERKTVSKESNKFTLMPISSKYETRYIPLNFDTRMKTNMLPKPTSKDALFSKPPRFPNIKRNFTGTDLELKENISQNMNRNYQSSNAARSSSLRRPNFK